MLTTNDCTIVGYRAKMIGRSIAMQRNIKSGLYCMVFVIFYSRKLFFLLELKN